MKRDGKTVFPKIITFVLLALSIILIITSIFFYNILFPQTTAEKNSRPGTFKGDIVKSTIVQNQSINKDESINIISNTLLPI